MTRIEVLYFEGCPNGQPAIDMARQVAIRLGGDIETIETLVTEDAVERLRFLGSPTVRVDGRDVDPGAQDRTGFHYGCRIYDTRAGRVGLPPEEWVLAAAQEAQGPRPWLTIGRVCSCSPDCWCRSGWRRRVRWLWPVGHRR